MTNPIAEKLKILLEKTIHQELNSETNLYELGVDSFSLVEIINALQLFCADNNFLINMDAITTEEVLSINTIIPHLKKEE